MATQWQRMMESLQFRHTVTSPCLTTTTTTRATLLLLSTPSSRELDELSVAFSCRIALDIWSIMQQDYPSALPASSSGLRLQVPVPVDVCLSGCALSSFSSASRSPPHFASPTWPTFTPIPASFTALPGTLSFCSSFDPR